jgi:hypothetical protein
MKAYENHFHVDNVTNIDTMSYDMGGIIFQP